MKPGWIALIVVVALALLAVGGYSAWTWQQTGALPGQVAEPASDGAGALEGDATGDAADDGLALPVRAGSAIVAEAVVVPSQWVTLSFAVPGIVAELPVLEGEQVRIGQVLARLQSNREVIAVAQAQSVVDAARALVDQLTAGARPEEIASAAAAVDAAQAQLDLLLEGAHPEDLAALQAAVAGAQASYAQVAAGADDQALIAAQADLANAQTAVTRAQRAYDLIAWRSDVGTTAEAAALQTATNNLEAAQARYNDIAAGADDNQLAQAAAAIAQAQAALDRAAAPPTAAQIAAAEAEVRRAEAGRDLVVAGSRPEVIAAAQADLAGAETALLQAQLNLSDRTLTAPFTGTVAMLDLRVGQQVSAGLPVVQLADDSTWLVETTDLTEIGVVDIQVGDRASVSVDALPDVELVGTVSAIRPRGVNVLGDITYKVTIVLDEGDPRLRWNMTAAATIEP